MADPAFCPGAIKEELRQGPAFMDRRSCPTVLSAVPCHASSSGGTGWVRLAISLYRVDLMSPMSESAANVKLFVSSHRCVKLPFANTLQATGAEDKPLLGSKLSADSGAKTRLEFGEKSAPAGKLDSLGLARTR
jgi:hypothetical protein